MDRNLLIIWNVGQGSSASIVEEKACSHIDIGGEVDPTSRIKTLCNKKENNLSISHWDWDHYSFLKKLTQKLPRTCIFNLPNSKVPPRVYRLVKGLSRCPKPKGNVRLEYIPKKKQRKKNENSLIISTGGSTLIPGDSTVRMERLWSKKIKDPNKFKTLVLGHHGSLTSTSKKLLQRLKNLKMAVASARKARYGHPHPKVTQRLKDNGIAVISTEDWGNIILEI